MNPTEILFCDLRLEDSRGIRAALRARGVRVSALASPRLLLQRLSESVPDLLVLGETALDLEPDFLVRLLRGRYPRLPILLKLDRADSDCLRLREELRIAHVAVPPHTEEGFLAAIEPLLGAPEPAPLGPLVLCVDDEPAFLNGLSRLLRLRGYRVACYGDPEQALEALPFLSPDLVVLDVAMRGMSGLQMAEEIREVYGRSLPVLVLSGLDSDREIRRGYRSGADCYLTKPCAPSVLVDTIARMTGPAAAAAGGCR